MEAAAIASIQKDYGLFAGTASAPFLPIPSQPNTAPAPRPAIVPSRPPPSAKQIEPEMTKSDWNERKRAREEEKRKKLAGEDDEDTKRAKVTIGPDDGWYTDTNATTWLEGIVFGDILEAEMPIQLWSGHASATLNEKRVSSGGHYWHDAVVADVRARPSSMHHADRLVLDVSYLKEGEEEETLQKSVALANVRVRLGNPLDTRIPLSVEQARLLAMGGEEIDVETSQEEVMDEATGLSSWKTVKVTRTTSLLEEKQKREATRARIESRKQAAAEAETRRLQEVAHAPDSALGAYDVWGKQSGGYKGVNIERDTQVDVASAGKKLAEGPVAFKKGTNKKRNRKGNRRTTSADD